MSFAFQDDKVPEFETKTDVHYRFKISYVKIAEAVREGKIALHHIDGKIYINMAEAQQVFGHTAF